MNPVSGKTRDLDSHFNRLLELGPAGWSALHISGFDARRRDGGYPARWIKRYEQRNYGLRDPLIGWSFESDAPRRWSDPTITDPHGILADAMNHGLRFGAMAATGPLYKRSIAVVAREDREVSDDELVILSDIVQNIHTVLCEAPDLTEKQREALRMVASGMRMAQTAEAIGVSQSALKARLRSVRDALGTRTLAETVDEARAWKLI